MVNSPSSTSITSLTSLITSTANSKTHPSPDLLLQTLHSRSRSDLPYTYVGDTTLIVVNPLRALASGSDESAKAYAERTKEVRVEEREVGQPHVYELAGRVWGLMRRRREDQVVVFSGPTNSGKSYSSKLLTLQVLRLSASSPGPNGTFKFTRTALQVQALLTVLESFGSAKTITGSQSSQVGRWMELFFSKSGNGGGGGSAGGNLIGAQVLTFGLNKSKMVRLEREERTFHVFYQLLAGASPAERDSLGLLDPSDYDLLASSGCYRLPGGPFSDDSTQFDELRAAMASLGFKSKHLQSIFNVLVCLLSLGNLKFSDRFNGGGPTYESCEVEWHSKGTLDDLARRLGIDPGELEESLTNETKWVGGSGGGRKELCSVFLDAKAATRQRESLIKNLYAILFAFIVETANRKLSPPEEEGVDPEEHPNSTVIAQLDLPGFQSRNFGTTDDPRVSQPLITTQGDNGVEEFAINFANELVQSYISRRAFGDDADDTAGWNAELRQDGVELPSVVTMDNAACVELLRGGVIMRGSRQLGGKPGGLCGLLEAASGKAEANEEADAILRHDEEMVDDLFRYFGRHTSLFRPQQARKTMFGVNHYAGPVIYDAANFIDRNTDVLDAQFVGLLRGSTDTFIAKLFSGPSIAAESHPMDENTIVQSQVAVVPLRDPSRLNGGPSSKTSFAAYLDPIMAHPITSQINATMTMLLLGVDTARLWNVLCIRPNDSGHPGSFDKRKVKAQILASGLPDLVLRKEIEYAADMPFEDFAAAHGLRRGSGSAEDVHEYAVSRGWEEGRHFALGKERIWFTYAGWRLADDLLRSRSREDDHVDAEDMSEAPGQSPRDGQHRSLAGRHSSQYGAEYGQTNQYGESVDDLLIRRTDTQGSDHAVPAPGHGFTGYENDNMSAAWTSEYDKPLASSGLSTTYPPEKVPGVGADGLGLLSSKEAEAAGMVVHEKGHTSVQVVPTSKARRWWVRIVWLLTWWVPSFLLSWIGRMKRPDIRMAWREKLAIFIMIISMCGIVIFYIVVFGRLLCPNMNKAWNTSELAQHAGTDDYYAAIAGKVYDFTKFYKIQHSDIAAYPTSSSIMLELAGLDLTDYFPVPFTQACPGLVTSESLFMQRANFTPIVAYAIHTSGSLQTTNGTELNKEDWYYSRLTPFIEQYYKGQFVFDKADIQSGADQDGKMWAIYENGVYDLSDYFATITYYATSSGTDVPNYSFLNSNVTALFKQQPGVDITKDLNEVFATMSLGDADQQKQCLMNAFFLGSTDFRKTARCEVQNYLLLAFSVLLMSTIVAKFLAALQLGSKRYPEMQDKFVLCQVPCYTEGEESLRRTIDSLAGLKYDDKRKLMFIICDGNIIGSGNDRPTPRIVLDILGVDPKLDPEPLLFKSVGEGAKQLNYAKVYSGLYEYEGHVVPYMVIVKVGKPSERSKPGNRGKRDSQVLLLHYLNRVHFDAPMNPLELEIFHQMRNIIGIDPAFYEYIFQVDADTTVTPDSLNRMVACASDDSSIIGICGETKLSNERQSLTTMIQVYEYYISHNLTKAFESLFGSVTCLPGCFSVYRIRTADKGRPIIISSRVIDEYSEPNVDTLHKKNLFSLGEDRYLTTLMMKHFPTFKMKFTADAIAHTVAPDKWSILLSQRRRWINSTIHNLSELLFLPELCGFCLFSMRFIVFVDLLGTIILPATCVYLIYLIIVVSTGNAAIPYISIAMIAAVYGLQALIFILKREFMLIGWMIIYILAFPIYTFFLPLYSFWSMDDFSWGSTRLVVGEGNNQKIISDTDDQFDDSMIPLKRFSEYEAETWDTASLVQSEPSELASEKASMPGNGRKNLSRRPPPQGEGDRGSVTNSGDFYRDSTPLGRLSSNRNLRPMPSSSSLHSGSNNAPADPRHRSMAGLSQWGAGSAYGGGPVPIHNPFMAATPAGSDCGGMANNYMGVNNPYMMGVAGPPRNSVMTGLNDYNGGNMQQQPQRPQTLARPISTFSFATTANPFSNNATPPANQSEDPTDDEIVQMVSDYLSTRDLMTVTKRKVREGVIGLFPRADLSNKTTFINQSIDRLLTA